MYVCMGIRRRRDGQASKPPTPGAEAMYISGGGGARIGTRTVRGSRATRSLAEQGQSGKARPDAGGLKSSKEAQRDVAVAADSMLSLEAPGLEPPGNAAQSENRRAIGRLLLMIIMLLSLL